MAGIKFRVLLDSNQKEEVFCDILLSLDDNFESFFKFFDHDFEFLMNFDQNLMKFDEI